MPLGQFLMILFIFIFFNTIVFSYVCSTGKWFQRPPRITAPEMESVWITNASEPTKV